MTQKWNLQDIRPAHQPRPSTRPAPGTVDNLSARPNGRPVSHGQSQTHPSTPAYQTQNREPEPTFHHQNHTEMQEADEEGYIPVVNGNKKRNHHLIAGVVISIIIVATGIGVSSFTGGTKITIHPKVKELNVNADFTAYTEKKPGELSYEVMTLDETGERQVKATGQETITKQASGEIEITKTTAGVERLIKNTRFSTSNGLIFRIQESVTVPGAVKGTDGKMNSGSIRAQVFAEEPGDKYNVPAGTAMTVPGFKEGNYMDLFNAISAKATAPFIDGFSGPKFIINDAELSTAKQSLQMELRDKLLAKIKEQRPADFTSFTDSISITYNTLPPTQYGDNLVTIKEQAILQIPLFKKEDFASYVAKQTIVGYENEPVRIDNVDNLTFKYANATTSQTNIANLPSLSFKIAGVPKIVWTFDAEKMKTELLGKEKTAFNQVLSNYTGIEKGEVEVRPFWKSSFSTSLKDITIIEDLSTVKTN